MTILFTLSLVFSSQINFAGGSIVSVKNTGSYYTIATDNMIYVFEDGIIKNQVDIESISDFDISKGILVVASMSQKFPNIRAFSFPELAPLWEFEPKMDVFDMSLVWTKKQTRSWRVKAISKGFGVASGYSLYILSPSGSLLGNFTANSDIWDFAEKDGFDIATQEGAVYVIDPDLKLIEKKELCKPYSLLDRISNQTIGEYPRSVWDVDGTAATCEDGTVQFMDNNSYAIKTYTESQLYSYYYQSRKETGYGSSMFRNLKMKSDGNIEAVYTSNKLVVFEGSNEKWTKDLKILDVDINEGKIYVLTMTRNSLEVLNVYSHAGELIKTIESKGLSCKEGTYKLLAGEAILIAGPCEVKLLDTNGKTKWSLPKTSNAGFFDSGNLHIIFSDNEKNQQGSLNFYSFMALNGSKLLWKYSLPNELAKKGSLSDLKVVGNKYVVAEYSADGNDGLIVVEIRSGTSWFRNSTLRKYAGGFDEYLLNASFTNLMKNYSYSLLDMIPDDFKYGIDMSLDTYGVDNVVSWLTIMQRLPAPVRVMESLRSMVNELPNYEFSRRIENIDTCDYNGDGVKDLLVNSGDFFTILDGTNLKELLLKDSQMWRYNNMRINVSNFTASWFTQNGKIFCIDDFSGDGVGELLLGTWSGNVTLILSDGSTKWQMNYKNLNTGNMRKIGDIDGDGIEDFLISSWVKDRPDTVFFVSSRDGTQRYSFSPNQLFFRRAVGDVDGDGKNENVLVYDSEGANLLVFSPTYKFEYNGIQNLWDTWNDYGKVMPAEIVPDMNGDGYNEIVVGAVRRWDEPSMALLFFDGKTKEVLKQVNVEGNGGKSINPDEWTFISDVRRFGNTLFFTIPGQSGGGSTSGKAGIYDLSSKKIKAYINKEIKEVVEYGNSIVLIGKSGEVFKLESTEFPEPSVSVDGPVVNIASNESFFTSVSIDGDLSGSGRKTNFSIRLQNGKHNVVVSLTDRSGFQKLFTHSVETFTSSDLSFLNKIIFVIVVLFGAFKVVTKWK